MAWYTPDDPDNLQFDIPEFPIGDVNAHEVALTDDVAAYLLFCHRKSILDRIRREENPPLDDDLPF
jgi:hypothetical protein